jgi:hypothetical protein
MELIIHEFSTGITPEGNEQRWVSKGFTGRYMNMTMAEVPSVVERAIANHGFAVAEGTSSDQPAIIGRVVVGTSEQESWSVIAFVTRGEDEYGRSFGFHRYFLCQGMDSMGMLIEWLEAYRQHKGHYPVFNPFKLRQPAKPNRWETPQLIERNSDAPQWIHEKTPAIAPWQEVLSMAEINDFAEQKANGQREQIAWALDVEALEQAERFLIIKPASARAAQILQQPVAMSTRSRSTYTAIDEAAIKGAIKGLINSNQVNESLFETLVSSIEVVKNELESDVKVSKYWNDIFDKQGASNALSQNISSPQMNRLLVLRAILIPDTLYQYLQWLNIEKANRLTSKGTESLDFQQRLKLIAKDWQSSNPELFKDFINNLIEGIKNLLYKENTTKEAIKKLSLEPEIWVLTFQGGIWNSCKELFQKMIAEDLPLTRGRLNPRNPQRTRSNEIFDEYLQIKSDYQLNGKEWEKIWHDISRYRDNQYVIRFLPFAELFDAIGNPALAACFYQLAKGEVPAEIYKKVDSKYRSQPFGIQIFRAQTPFEKFVAIALPVALVTLGVSAVVAFGFLVYYGLKILINPPQAKETPANTPQLNPPSSPSKEVKTVADILKTIKTNPDKYKKAIEKFEDTKKSLKVISEKITPDSKKNPGKIEPKLEEVLWQDFKSVSESRLDFSKIINSKINDSNNMERDRWIAAIYFYQTRHSNLKENADGILSTPSETPDNFTAWCLINDVKKKLGRDNVNICEKINPDSSTAQPFGLGATQPPSSHTPLTPNSGQRRP